MLPPLSRIAYLFIYKQNQRKMDEEEFVAAEEADSDPGERNEEFENGYLSPFYYSATLRDEDTEESDDDFEAAEMDQFDTDLPTTHRYLGVLNNVDGYTLYDEGETVTTMGIYTNTLVFPGFTLPLMMTNQHENMLMKNFLEKHRVFVLLCDDERYLHLFGYGVTMEIYETQVRDGLLCLKARGRQRCRLLMGQETRSFSERIQKVTVRVLGEPPVLPTLCDTQFLTLKGKKGIVCNDYIDLQRNFKYRRHHLSQYPLANWIYDRYEACYLVKHILEGLAEYYIKEYIPVDPVKLSYWFVQNFQLQHAERLKILELSSTLERLRLELQLLHMKRLIVCMHCENPITEQSHVFAMSKDGVQSNYCNPGGHVYETVTVKVAKNFFLIGGASKQFSWFPGYAWTIMQCKGCNTHLGWMFTSKHLKPNTFYGLAKSGFSVKIVMDDEGQPGPDNPVDQSSTTATALVSLD